VDGNGFYFKNDEANANLGDVEPRDGVKLNFTKNPALSSMDIVDRDATDGYAEIAVPADWAEATSIDLWIRVLGKPAGASGWTLTSMTGDVLLRRHCGVQAEAARARIRMSAISPMCGTALMALCLSDRGEQLRCISDTTGLEVDAVELNVFNNAFEEYFWDINNAGIRVAQVLMRANFPK